MVLVCGQARLAQACRELCAEDMARGGCCKYYYCFFAFTLPTISIVTNTVTHGFFVTIMIIVILILLILILVIITCVTHGMIAIVIVITVMFY